MNTYLRYLAMPPDFAFYVGTSLISFFRIGLCIWFGIESSQVDKLSGEYLTDLRRI